MLKGLKRLPFRPIFAIAVTISIGGYLISQYSLGESLKIISEIPYAIILTTGMFVIVSLLASCIRYFSILKNFRINLSLLTVARANILGALGGLLFFHIIGQTLTRHAILKNFSIPSATTFFTTFYERILALVWLLILAFLGGAILFGSISVDLVGGGYEFIELLVVSLLTLLFAAILSYQRLVRFLLRKLGKLSIWLGVLRDSFATIFVHAAMLLAYVLLVISVSPDVALIDVIAASSIVMLAASMPISFAGWGVREISAVYAYSAIGLSPEQAIAVGLTLGMLSIVSLVGLSGIAMLLKGAESNAATESILDKKNVTTSKQVDLRRALSWALPLLCATFVLVQVQLPTSTGKISVNLADPFAILGGGIFLFWYVSLQRRFSVWRSRLVENFILSATFVLLLSLCISFYRYGFTDWAFINRFLGWFVILGYFFTGALIVSHAGRSGFYIFSYAYIVSVSVIFVLQYLGREGSELGFFPAFLLPNNPGFPGFDGLAANPNAFAFQLLVAVSLLIAIISVKSRSHFRLFGEKSKLFLLVILVAAIWYSKSRAGIGALVVLLSAAYLFKFITVRQVLVTLLGSFVVVALIPLIGLLMNAISYAVSESSVSIDASISYVNPIREASDNERMVSLRGAWELFTEYPFFGAGLGAFVNNYFSDTGKLLVIHSTPLWVLAEMGLLGLLVFLSIFAVVIKTFYSQVTTTSDIAPRVGVLIMISFLVIGLPHDMFYQRVFWLFMGSALAYKIGKSTNL